jgi:hypothetical protein
LGHSKGSPDRAAFARAGVEQQRASNRLSRKARAWDESIYV